jgi:hypothetical protein
MLCRSALLTLVCLMLGPVAAVAAPSAPAIEASEGETLTQRAQYWGDRGYHRDRYWDQDNNWHRRRYCERLRRACIHKDERGEWGEGNCRRYRYECGSRRW